MSTTERLFDGRVKSARISDCGRYRYLLTRDWSNYPTAPAAWWVMLNPSTADDAIDDPTIRRCIAFTRRFGLSRMAVVNLFAVRSANPGALYSEDDPVGPLNADYIDMALDYANYHQTPVICAWGNHGNYMEQSDWLIGRATKLAALPTLHHLGLTKSGQPKHPLYLRSDTELQAYQP